jgi:hypothetical protein
MFVSPSATSGAVAIASVEPAAAAHARTARASENTRKCAVYPRMALPYPSRPGAKFGDSRETHFHSQVRPVSAFRPAAADVKLERDDTGRSAQQFSCCAARSGR